MTWTPARTSLVSLATIGTVAALKLGADFLMPIAVAFLLSQLLGPLVRGLRRVRIPEPAGAALVMLLVTGAAAVAVSMLAAPAANWFERAPESLRQAERKIRRLARPIQTLGAAAEKVESAASGATAKPVQVAKPGLLQRLGDLTTTMAGGILSVVFLSYFLLAAAPLFRRKLAAVVPEETTRHRIAQAMREVEGHMSRYLLLTTLTCIAVGIATTAWLSVVGMPSPGLWGVVAGGLNLVPYLGAVATLTIIGGAALVSFDGFQQALLAVGGFGVINLLEGNLLTPMLLGRKLPLNQVAVFVGFLFWGWVWGITGMVLAVPMMVLIKVGCDRVELTRPVAVFLDN